MKRVVYEISYAVMRLVFHITSQSFRIVIQRLNVATVVQ